MNHSWLEDQKFRANNARYRETGHSHETPSEYIIRKMDLIRLVYNYTDSEIIRLVMKEAPDFWAPLLQPQFCQSAVQFQNTVKYHKSSLLRMTPPAHMESDTTHWYLENSLENNFIPDNNSTSETIAKSMPEMVTDSVRPTYPHDPGPHGLF